MSDPTQPQKPGSPVEGQTREFAYPELPEDPQVTYDPRKSDIISGNTTLSRDFKFTPSDRTIADMMSGDPTLPSAIEQYHLITGIGQGGFGEVWRARQPSLNRLVAVKRIRREFYTDPQRIPLVPSLEHSFRQEALTTASLDHPFIIPIYGMGRDEEGYPALAMKLIEGEPWHSVLEKDMVHMAWEDYLQKHLPILLDVAQAVAFAHSRGIIHRDIKPSQVMIGQYGQIYLMDWGLAYVFDGERAQERFGKDFDFSASGHASNPAGTASYMAPEQTEDTLENLGPWTDVYLLGATLYTILTGAPPHHAANSQESFEKARLGSVPPPKVLKPGRQIPAELAQLCEQCLVSNPKKRLQSVQEYITFLRNYLSGVSRRRDAERLIEEEERRLARPDLGYSELQASLSNLDRAFTLWPAHDKAALLKQQAIETYVKTALVNEDLVLARVQSERIEDAERRRHLMMEIERHEELISRRERQRRFALGAAGMLLILLLVGGLKYLLDQRAANIWLQDARDRAVAARAEAETQRDRAEDALYIANRERYLSAISIIDKAHDEGELDKAAEFLYTRTPEGFANWEWGYQLQRLHPEDFLIGNGPWFDARFSPSGERLLLAGRGRFVEYSASTGERIAEHALGSNNMWSAAYSPDGRYVAAGSFDRRAYIIDTETWQEVRRFDHDGLVRCAEFSPDGQIIATAGYDNTFRLYTAETGELLFETQEYEAPIYVIAFSPNGGTVATGGLDRNLILRDGATGRLVRRFEQHPENILGLAWTPDGRTIVTAGADRIWRAFDAATGRKLLEIDTQGEFLHSIDVSPDGRMVATGNENGYCALWSLQSGEKLGGFQVDNPTIKVRFSPDGSRLLTTSYDGVRMVSMNRVLPDPRRDTDPNLSDAANADGIAQVYGVPIYRDVVWATREREWNVDSGVTLVNLLGRSFAILSRYAAFSPDWQRRVDIDPETGSAVVIDTSSGDVIKEFDSAGYIRAAFSPDGGTLALAENTDRIHLWHTATWELRATLARDPDNVIEVSRDKYHINALEFSPDGKRLAVGYLNQRLLAWDMENPGDFVEFPASGGAILTVAWSPDGELLAAGGTERTIKLFDAATGELLGGMQGHNGSILSLRMSPDSQRVLTFSTDTTVRLWHVDARRELLSLGSYTRENYPVLADFTGDGKNVYIVTTQREVHLFEALPWNLEEYGGDTELSLPERVEGYNRAKRLAEIPNP